MAGYFFNVADHPEADELNKKVRDIADMFNGLTLAEAANVFSAAYVNVTMSIPDMPSRADFAERVMCAFAEHFGAALAQEQFDNATATRQ